MTDPEQQPPVSRETPPTPEAAAALFRAERLPLAERYAALLADEGVVRGLIGPREAPRLWQRHLLNCAVLADVVPEGSAVCDIGSGAGLPGLVLAIARSDVTVTLVEPLLRRTTFLEEAVAALGLDRVEVVRARAEELHGRRRFDVVTSRAVAPLERLLDWSMPLVDPAGVLLAMKGSSAESEVAAAADALERWGCAPAEVLSLGEGRLEQPTAAVLVSWADPSRVSWPVAAPAARSGRRRSRGPARGGRSGGGGRGNDAGGAGRPSTGKRRHGR